MYNLICLYYRARVNDKIKREEFIADIPLIIIEMSPEFPKFYCYICYVHVFRNSIII